MGYRVALDIGTTNIQALLIDTSHKRQIDFLNIKNSQVIYGKDIITRLGLSLKNKNIQEEMSRSLTRDLELLIGFILKRNRLSFDRLEKVIACGNSAMHHILLGLPLESLARAPFKPVHLGQIFETTLEDLGIETEEDKTPFIFLPNLGGFVGSDALCTIVETGIYRSKTPLLAIDLGTNGEIMLGSKKRIFVTSTSAGPAFEGWRIKCGIYGSALIDVVSDLLKNGTIDKSGFMRKGSFTYKLVGRPVEINQKDVREFQLAKAAISGGIHILKRHLGNTDIRKVYITGLFGAKINKSSAKAIGVLPDGIDLNKVEIKQNAALLGAKTLCCCRNINKKLDPIMRIIEHIELHKEPAFQDTFTASIPF